MELAIAACAMALKQFVRSGINMPLFSSNFSWVTALGKGVRDALLSLVPTVGAAIVLAVAGVVDSEHLTTYGVPIWLIPVSIALFSSIRNILRNKYKWPV